MKSKKTLLSLILIFTSVNLIGQITSSNLKIEGHSYPNPSVTNFIKWINLTTMEWEAEMKQTEFNDRGLDNGCVYYGTGSSLTKAVFSISKCPGNMMSVEWKDFSFKGITKLDALVNELEPYYKSTNEKSNSIYSFRDGESTYYEFTVHRENSFEFIIVKKYTL